MTENEQVISMRVNRYAAEDWNRLGLSDMQMRVG